MRVANLGHQDLCSIGTNLSRGLRALGHDAHGIALEPPDYAMGVDLLWSRDEATCRRTVADADVLHVNSLTVGFTLWLRRAPVDLARAARGKGLVVQYHGTDLRRSTHPSVKALLARHRVPAFVTVPDLLPHLPGSRWLPIPVEPDAPEYAPARPPASPIRICHAPTTRAIKKTDAFLAAVERLRARYDVEPVLIEGRPYTECLALKRTCHVNFDNIGYGSYALGSIESMLMEQPSLVYLNGASRAAVAEQGPLAGGECPLVQVGDPRQPSHEELRAILEGRAPPTHTEEDVASIVRALEPLVGDDGLRREIGRRSRAWAAAVHDVRRVARLAADAYERAPRLDGFNPAERLVQFTRWGAAAARNLVQGGS